MVQDPELPQDEEEVFYYMFERSGFEKSNSFADSLEVQGKEDPNETELQALIGAGGLLSAGSFAAADMLGEREQASLAETIDAATNPGSARKALKLPKEKKKDVQGVPRKTKNEAQSLMTSMVADASSARRFAATLPGFGIAEGTITRLSTCLSLAKKTLHYFD